MGRNVYFHMQRDKSPCSHCTLGLPQHPGCLHKDKNPAAGVAQEVSSSQSSKPITERLGWAYERDSK